MTITVTTIMGGLGRVILDGSGHPVQIGGLGPVYDAEVIEGVTGEYAALLGPVDDTDRVPGGAVTATGGTT